MKLEIDIPDPEFKIGEFVRFRKNGADLVVRIYHVIGEGTWDLCDGSVDWDSRWRIEYLYVLQDGCLAENGKPLRPGRLLVSPVWELEKYSQRVCYEGRVWESDTVMNVNQREVAWEREHPDAA